MKALFSRKVALLTLPILITASAAWLHNQKWNPFDTGPLRVEYSSLEPGRLKLSDVTQGRDWAAQTIATVRGHWEPPTGWKFSVNTTVGARDLQLLYRRKNTWESVPQKTNNHSTVVAELWVRNNLPDLTTIKVDLAGVPRDADEVRVRGKFCSYVQYKGTAPQGWKAPKDMKILHTRYGNFHIFEIQSKPFDFHIKGQNEAMPEPVISRYT